MALRLRGVDCYRDSVDIGARGRRLVSRVVRRRVLALGVMSCALTACAAGPDSSKPRDLTAAERDSLSQVLEPLLTAAGLWRGPVDGCAAAFGVVQGEPIGAEVTPHAPCRVKLVLTEGTLTRLDRATLRVVLAHELAHLQLGHEDARQERAEERKKTEKGVKSASSAASKAASFIPGVGGWVSKGIGTTRKVATAAMEAQGNAYLGEEERAADALAVTYLNEVESAGCGALVRLLAERLRDSAEDAWTPWLREHPVSTERVEALAGPCPAASSPYAGGSARNPGTLPGNERDIAWRQGTCAMVAGSSAASGGVWRAVTGPGSVRLHTRRDYDPSAVSLRWLRWRASHLATPAGSMVPRVVRMD